MEENQDQTQDIQQEEVGHKIPELLSQMTGYDHLYLMCKHVRNKSNSGSGYLNPITPRLQYIMDALAYQGIQYSFVPLESWHNASEKSEYVNPDDRKLANVMVQFYGTNPEKPTVIFTAHHDIANPNSENCQDNTASVCNLIHLCQVLKEYQANGLLEQNVVIGFTDCEEIGGRGMNMLVTQINNGVYGEVEAMFALELTANGKNVWVQGLREGTAVSRKINSIGLVDRVRTPYNESMNAARVGLPAVCIGTLTDDQIKDVQAKSYCATWGLCHSMEDTFERSAIQEDMNQFVATMVGLIDTHELEFEDAEEVDSELNPMQQLLEEGSKEETNDTTSVEGRLDHISTYEDGWNNGEGVAYKKEELDKFYELYKTNCNTPDFDIYPMTDGSLELEWSTDDYYDSVTINLSTLKAEFHSYVFVGEIETAFSLDLTKVEDWNKLNDWFKNKK
jgi:hypothetical protein